MTNNFSSTQLQNLGEFYDYVMDFYGGDDPLYPLTKEDGSTLKREDIISATKKYFDIISKLNLGCFTWDDGDSLDRERVRDILIKDYGYQEFKPEFTATEFPSTHCVIEKMVELKGKGADTSDLDGFIYDAISEWDDEFDGNPLWYNEEETDAKDDLRQTVLGVMEELDIKIEDLTEVFDIHSAIRSYCLKGENGFDIGEAE